jgi:hypothetical protein
LGYRTRNETTGISNEACQESGERHRAYPAGAGAWPRDAMAEGRLHLTVRDASQARTIALGVPAFTLLAATRYRTRNETTAIANEACQESGDPRAVAPEVPVHCARSGQSARPTRSGDRGRRGATTPARDSGWRARRCSRGASPPGPPPGPATTTSDSVARRRKRRARGSGPWRVAPVFSPGAGEGPAPEPPGPRSSAAERRAPVSAPGPPPGVLSCVGGGLG